MSARLKKVLWGWTSRTDAVVGLVSAVVSTGLFAGLAQRWTDVTGGSWPASIFMGIGVVCVIALVGSVVLIALRYFRPILPQPGSEGAAAVGVTTPALETIPLHRFTAALQKAGLLEFKFDEAVQKIDSFIAAAKTQQEAREKLIGQMRSALTARRQLELAQELFAAVEKAYAKIDDPDKIDLDTFTQDNNTAQSLMRRYYNDFLQNNDAAKNLFRVSPHELSPSYWKGVNLSKLATDREIEHQFKTSRLWFIRIGGHHNELRGRCNRLIDFEGG
jgi:hypothetical protein